MSRWYAIDPDLGSDPVSFPGAFSVPRYFFDLNDGAHTHDNDGAMLSDWEAVEQRAKEALCRAALEKRATAFSPPMTLTVRDHAGKPVYVVTATVRSAWHAKPKE